MKKKIYHRRANHARLYAEMEEDGVAECDLVKIWGKLYLFHPGGLFTLFMAGPGLWFFFLTWPIWKFFGVPLPYEELLELSRVHQKAILLELKNIKPEDVDELPFTLHHIDTYNMVLAQDIKKKFPTAKVSIHLLFCTTKGGFVLKSRKGHLRFHTWEELADMDIITPTYQLSLGWMNPKFWSLVKFNAGKPIFIGGGFRSKLLGTLAKNFDEAKDEVDGWYER